ncbi:MAG: helix-turn-helix domain-containing protein [Desulfovibrio sp.]|nr:helix-turn-helix domain-containing protein [Desulfovibrio sp.]
MLMSIREVAGMLGISVSSIQRLVRAERFPQPVRMLGSLVRWRRADIATFATGRAVSATVSSSAPQEQEEARPRRGGRPKGSKNRRTLAKEAWRNAYGPGRADD